MTPLTPENLEKAYAEHYAELESRRLRACIIIAVNDILQESTTLQSAVILDVELDNFHDDLTDAQWEINIPETDGDIYLHFHDGMLTLASRRPYPTDKRPKYIAKLDISHPHFKEELLATLDHWAAEMRAPPPAPEPPPPPKPPGKYDKYVKAAKQAQRLYQQTRLIANLKRKIGAKAADFVVRNPTLVGVQAVKALLKSGKPAKKKPAPNSPTGQKAQKKPNGKAGSPAGKKNGK